MPKKLPIITYKKKKYYVDFRLKELRGVKDAKAIKFTQLKEKKNSKVKRRLRKLRFKHWRNEYIKGVDD